MKDTQTIYEQLGGTYREENGNLVPDVELPEQKSIGKYGRTHLDYLKQHRRGRYSALLGEGRLNAYLADVDKPAQERLTSLTRACQDTRHRRTPQSNRPNEVGTDDEQRSQLCRRNRNA